MGITEHTDAFVMGAGSRLLMSTCYVGKKKEKFRMERDQFPPTLHCVIDLTFIAALSANA